MNAVRQGNAVHTALSTIIKAMEYLRPHLEKGTFEAPDWAIDLASILTGGSRLSPETITKCDGNHPGPPCDDAKCWNVRSEVGTVGIDLGDVRGPFKVYDPNSSVGVKVTYRPAWIYDADDKAICCVSTKGEPKLAHFIVRAMNASWDNRGAK